jgi:hypothetical protein
VQDGRRASGSREARVYGTDYDEREW